MMTTSGLMKVQESAINILCIKLGEVHQSAGAFISLAVFHLLEQAHELITLRSYLVWITRKLLQQTVLFTMQIKNLYFANSFSQFTLSIFPQEGRGRLWFERCQGQLPEPVTLDVCLRHVPHRETISELIRFCWSYLRYVTLRIVCNITTTDSRYSSLVHWVVNFQRW